MIVDRQVLMTLILISAVGLIAIPFGSPKFIGEAIAIELSFITLSVLIWRGYTRALYVCIGFAAMVFVGNSISPAHVHLMTTFSKPGNALILIIGGYILQGMLIYTSSKAIFRIRSKSLTQSSLA